MKPGSPPARPTPRFVKAHDIDIGPHPFITSLPLAFIHPIYSPRQSSPRGFTRIPSLVSELPEGRAAGVALAIITRTHTQIFSCVSQS